MVNELVERLKEQGYRITPQRRAIIEKVVEAGSSLTAAEIWQQVRKFHHDVGLDTIYRNINILVNVGVLVPIAGVGKEGTRYELVSAHHHHIVCVKCGQAICVDFCPISPQFLSMLNMRGYELVRHNIELFGVCAACKVV